MLSGHGLRELIAKTAPDSSDFTDCLIQSLRRLRGRLKFSTTSLFREMRNIATATASTNDCNFFMSTPTIKEIPLAPLPRWNTPALCSDCGNSYYDSRFNLATHNLGYGPASSSDDEITCPRCKKQCGTLLGLWRHIGKVHSQPFRCCLYFAGCEFQSEKKHVWRQHMEMQHLRFYYKCPSCHTEFSRKSTFERHSCRMHKAAERARSPSERLESNLYPHRDPPQKLHCPVKDCSSEFDGAFSWDGWVEHVGKHIENGDEIGIDNLFCKYAEANAIIYQVSDGSWRLSDSAAVRSNGEKRPPSPASIAPSGKRQALSRCSAGQL